MKISDTLPSQLVTPQKTTAARAASATENTAKTAKSREKEDFLQLSEEGRLAAQQAKDEALAREQALYEQRVGEKQAFDPQQIREQIEQANEQAKAHADRLKVLLQCFKISMNIMSGNKVPPKDMRFLAEKDGNMYMRAVMMRRQKEDPDKCKRVTEDEKKTAALQPNKPDQSLSLPKPPTLPEAGTDMPTPDGGEVPTE